MDCTSVFTIHKYYLYSSVEEVQRAYTGNRPMAHSSMLSITDLANMSTQIDKMNAELTNLSRVLEKLLATLAPLLGELSLEDEGIPASETKPSRQELIFEQYNVLNIDTETGTVTESANTSTDRLPRNDKSTTQYLPPFIPTLTCASFPMKVIGDVFYVGNGVTSVVGDAEIPSGIIVDATLVVKGNFTSGDNCRLLRNVKALKDITLGSKTVVEGNLVAGGKVTLGSSCIVHGVIESEGNIEIGEKAVIEGTLCSKSAIIADQSSSALASVYAAKGLSIQRAM